tara:strand:- start:48376 stop:48735 length:360 start_codon:yes stop_codon:yes gene_type:complete
MGMGMRVSGVKGGGVGGVVDSGGGWVSESTRGSGSVCVDGSGALAEMLESVDLVDSLSDIVGGWGGCTGSKLKGRLCSGRGERGDISCSVGISGFRVGDGVISGVSVSTCLLGIGGAGR